jgi:hypothetical protein
MALDYCGARGRTEVIENFVTKVKEWHNEMTLGDTSSKRCIAFEEATKVLSDRAT